MNKIAVALFATIIAGQLIVISNSYAHPYGHRHRRAGATAETSEPNVHVKKKKKKSSHVEKQDVPPGVATALPPKRSVAETTSGFAGMGNPGESSYAVPVVTPNHRPPAGIHANLELTRGSIYSSDAHVGNDKVTITRFVPRVLWDITEKATVYGQVPFSSYSPSSATEFDTVGRPEIGSLLTVYQDDNWKLGAGLSVKLPVFSFRGGDSEFVDPMRVWEISPGVAWDNTLDEDGATHFLGSIKAAYDTNASFSFNAVNQTTGFSQTFDGLSRPLSLVTALGLSHDVGTDLTLGLAVHTYHWLGTGSLTSGGSSVQTIPGVALSHGEFFASYRFNRDTSANASLTKGFKTDADPSTFALYEAPVEMADVSFSVGFTHVF